MLTDNRADLRTQDWFLVAYDGDLVLKLARDLMIGEDEQGQTVLSPARDNALLRIANEHGCLTLQPVAMDWTLSLDGGLSVQHLTFLEGLTLRLVFPHSSLLITTDFQAGGDADVDREVRLTPMQTPTLTLTRVDDPIVLMEPEQRTTPEPIDMPAAEDSEDFPLEEAEAQVRAAAALTQVAHGIPDEQLDEQDPVPAEQIPLPDEPAVFIVRPISRPEPTVERLKEVRVEPVEPPIPMDDAPPQGDVDSVADVPLLEDVHFAEDAHPVEAGEDPLEDRVVSLAAHRPTRRRHRALAGIVAALALATPMCLYLSDASELGVKFSLTNYRPLTESNAAPVRTEPAALPDQAQALSREDRLLIASLLAEANAYYQAGSIVMPFQSNAVSNLTQVLSMDPANREALRLMQLCEEALIERAAEVHAAGNNFLARNLVEGVLEFYPELDDARALLNSWTRTPEG
jgi:hypothetical protein